MTKNEQKVDTVCKCGRKKVLAQTVLSKCMYSDPNELVCVKEYLELFSNPDNWTDHD